MINNTLMPILPTDIVVCLYNTQMRPILDNTFKKATLIGPKLNPYDLCCLQECFDEKHKLISMSDHKFTFAPTLKRNCWSLVDSGLIIKTNYEVIFEHFEIYRSYATFQDIIASKGIAMVRLRIKNLLVDVYSTHMQAGSGQAGHIATGEQTAQLIACIQKYTPSENGLILLGDFNMGPKRGDLTYDKYNPPYDTHENMVAATTKFEFLKSSLNVVDVADFLGVTGDQFDRCLIRSSEMVVLTPIKFSVTSFVDSDGVPLSDANPFIINLNCEQNKDMNIIAQTNCKQDI